MMNNEITKIIVFGERRRENALYIEFRKSNKFEYSAKLVINRPNK